MYATIMQSRSLDFGIRQTAFIPAKGEPFIFTRTLGQSTKMRGSAGAWLPVSRLGRADLYNEAELEEALGQPVSVFMTANDELDIYNGNKPTTLLQKLARAVQNETKPTNDTWANVSADLFRTIDHKPEHLSRYAKGNRFGAPAVAIVREEPVAVVPEPISINEPTQTPVAVPEPEMALAKQNGERFWARLSVPAKPLNYIEREIDGFTEIEYFTRGLNSGDSFLLSGEAGVGKTESVTHLASHLGLPLVRVEMHQSLSLADTEGRLLPTPDGGWAWHYSRLATGIKNGAVILLNELSRSLPSNATLFLGLLNEKVLQIETLNEVIPVHPNTIFIADQNVGHRYVATREQDIALLDRFNVKLEYGDDPKIEAQLIPSPALLEIATALRTLSKLEPNKHRTRVGLRMLLNFVKQAKVYNFKWAVNRFLANFPEAEREAVSMQFEARYINIAQELSVPIGDYDPTAVYN